jgi:hypothetical protein
MKGLGGWLHVLGGWLVAQSLAYVDFQALMLETERSIR